MIYDYEGYKLHANAADRVVTVVDPRTSEALLQTTSLDRAMRWVSAYRRGDQTAVEAVAH